MVWSKERWVVPNKKAKQRKQERKKRNEWLKKYGRTRKQIERWKRRNKGKSIEDAMRKKRW